MTSSPGRLGASDERRNREIAAVVHELRTPLSTVRGFLETLLLRGDDLAPELRLHLLEVAVRNAVLLGQRIDTLLEHERFSTGDVGLNPLPSLVADSLERVVEDCTMLLRDHRVEVDVPAGLWAHVDGGALSHVLGNLLGNAAKHSPAGSTIVVRARAHGETVHVEVTDDGSGIDPRDLPHVFDPFFQGAEHARGVGLGLSVVHRYVTLWGGQVWIASSPGDGTTVTFTLPGARLLVELDDPMRQPDQHQRSRR